MAAADRFELEDDIRDAIQALHHAAAAAVEASPDLTGLSDALTAMALLVRLVTSAHLERADHADEVIARATGGEIY